MSKNEAEELFKLGMESLKRGETEEALDHLEKAVALDRAPLYCSYLAVCLAKGKKEYKKAVSLCNEAMRRDPKNSIHFLHLGRVHLMANQKRDALRIFCMGLRYGENKEIIAELNRFGRRRRPFIPFLERNNPLNKMLGRLTYRMGFR